MDGIERNGVAANAGFERQKKPEQQAMGDNELSESGIVTNAEQFRQQGSGWPEGRLRKTENGNWKASWSYADGRWPTVSPIRGGDDGLSSKLVKQCLEALGNAIVPQVAFEIFKAIEQFEAHTGDKV